MKGAGGVWGEKEAAKGNSGIVHVDGKARVKGWRSRIRTVWCAQRSETGMYLISGGF